MHVHDFDERRWPKLVVRCSVCLAIVAAGVWWFVTRERPVTPQQRLALLRDPTARPSARRLAAESLQRSDVRFVSELVQELREGDALGRELAAWVLGRPECKTPTVVEALVQTTNDAEASVRRQALIALGRVGTQPEQAVAALQGGAHDPDDSVRDGAFAALGRLREVGLCELLKLIADGDADVRRRAAIGLGQMDSNSDEVVERLHAALADADPRVRAESFAALSNLSSLDIAELAHCLKHDPDPLVCCTAVSLLARHAGANTELFIPALNDPERSVRVVALIELGKMGADAEGAVPAITALLDSEDSEMARLAADTLGKIGPAARGAVERLISCTGDPGLSSVALHALRRMGRERDLRRPDLFAALHADGDVARSLILWSPEPPLDREGVSLLSALRGPGYGVTDADMEHLKGLTHLAVLNLSSNPVGDAGLANLADLKELRRLFLAHTDITSAGLQHLAGLANLEGLDLSHCAVNDQGLKQLAHLRSLKTLHLEGTRLSDAGLAHLKGLTELRDLSLFFTKVSDNGLAWLSMLASLERLNLSHTRVTDAGLPHLRRLSKLRFLSLEATKVSQRGIEELRDALPGVTIKDGPAVNTLVGPSDREYEVLGLKTAISVQP